MHRGVDHVPGAVDGCRGGLDGAVPVDGDRGAGLRDAADLDAVAAFNHGDAVVAFDGVGVVVDRMSAPYLMGATIDFADTIEKQGFTIDNPNATGSCACGDSFH